MTDIALTWDNLDQDVKDQITGVGVDLVDVEYAQGDSSSVAPATGWQTTAPAWINGKYIWSRTKITYSNGTTSYTKAACISGGRGIKTIEEQYYLSSSSSTQTGGSWGNTAPAWKDKWYIWTRSLTTYTDGGTTTTDPICVSGGKGDTGNPGHDGINGAAGVNGTDGVSLVYKGEFSSHPANPQNGWYYRNSADKRSYVYYGAWYVMTIDGSNGANGTDGRNGLDGINGKDGNDGLSMVWKGNSTTPPANPQKNWCYRDTDNGRVYIYNGTAWALMVADGNDGTDGANGSNGLSVFITYHDGEDQPATPTGNGTAGGWHTDATAAVVWMSQKVAVDASSGDWGVPIRIKAKDGENGTDANLLPWVKDWNDKVYIDPKGEYFISPKIFSGKNTGTKEEPILTGIAMGHDCLTEPDGTKRTGIFALVDNEKVFELDPIAKKYLFKGRIETDEGVFGGYIKTPSVLIEQSDAILISSNPLKFKLSGNLNVIANNTCTIFLPDNIEYNGSHVNIVNNTTGHDIQPVNVIPDNKGVFGNSSQTGDYQMLLAGLIAFSSGILSIVAFPYGGKVRWHVITMPANASVIYYSQ